MSDELPSDLADLAGTIRRRIADAGDDLAGYFDADRPLIGARAPGRLDVMGGIADYSGSLVLEMPLAAAARVAAQRRDDRRIEAVTLDPAAPERFRRFALDLDGLLERCASLPEAAKWLRGEVPEWGLYVAGVFAALVAEGDLAPDGGVGLWIESSVPEGRGVSSSAAIEVAVSQALCGVYGADLSAERQAALAQRAENEVVGAPCGIMDQMTAACGQRDKLMALRCQPAELLEPIALPEGVAFWGIDSDVSHSVAGADYGSVRVGAFMGYRMLAELAGMEVVHTGEQQVAVRDERWGGYLANIAPSAFERHYADHLPEWIKGRRFLEAFDGTTDAATTIEGERDYRVRRPTAHPIHEHARVRLFAKLIASKPDAEAMRLLGELMGQSHASYSACGLGAEGTDRLVDLVHEEGEAAGLYGAKITGGGSGGAVAVIGRPDAGDAVERVAERYGRETGRKPVVFAGSSPGAGALGAVDLP